MRLISRSMTQYAAGPVSSLLVLANFKSPFRISVVADIWLFIDGSKKSWLVALRVPYSFVNPHIALTAPSLENVELFHCYDTACSHFCLFSSRTSTFFPAYTDSIGRGLTPRSHTTISSSSNALLSSLMEASPGTADYSWRKKWRSYRRRTSLVA